MENNQYNEIIKKLKDIKSELPSGICTFMVFFLLINQCEQSKKLDKIIEIQCKK